MIKNQLNALARHFAEQRFWRWATPLLAPGLALANPTGADIISGDVAITNTDANTLTIDQGSATAAINWQQFSIGSAEYVIFNQPSASALALNRVIGGTPSEIFGHLLSNGRIFLINPNGVLFGASATIDVGSLVASTANISDADFASGRYVFTGAGPGSVVNSGNIIAGPAGFVVLAADSVTNNGLIQANLGEVVLASGNAFTLDLTGEGLVNFAVDQAALSNQSGVTNLGQLVADGGKVLMTARTAADLARTVVNNQGLVQAHSISQTDSGEVVLQAVGGDVVNAGVLDASGVNGANGGTVTLVSDRATTLTPTSDIRANGDGLLATGGGVHVSGHTVSIRGLMNIGRGGNFLLDPARIHIYNGAGPNTSNSSNGFISEQFIEGQLQGGVNVSIVASERITLDNLTDNVLNGVNGGTSGDGSLTLGIGFVAGGSAYGGGAFGGGSFFRGSGAPGGGINFVDPGDAIIVGRSLRVIAGYANGDVNVGNLNAGGSIDVEGFGGVTVGAINAGGRVLVRNTGPGNIVVGDITAHSSASLLALHGNLDVDDVTVLTGALNGARLYMDAYGSGAGEGNIFAGEVTDTISVSNNTGRASFHADADGDIDVHNLVMHGGGGNSGSGPGANTVVTAVIHADRDITIHSANITTSPQLTSSGSLSESGFENVSNHGDAQIDLTAGPTGDVTLGEVGGGVFSVSAQGNANVTVNAGGTANLNNVAVSANGAFASHETSFTSFFGSSSSAGHNRSYGSAVSARLNVAAGNVAVPTGGIVTITGDGSAYAGLSAFQDVNIAGAITVTANAAHHGHSYGYTRNSSFGSTIRSDNSNSSASAGAAQLFVHANHDVMVQQTANLTVAGAGKARLDVQAGSPSYAGHVKFDGAASVTAGNGSFVYSRDHNSSSSFTHVSSNGSYGSAGMTINANNIQVGATAAITLTAAQMDFDAYAGYGAGAGILIDGAINLDGQSGAHFDRGGDSGGPGYFNSFGSHSEQPQARVEIRSGRGDIVLNGTIDAEAYGDARASFETFNNSSGDVILNGDITLTAHGANQSGHQYHSGGSTYFNSYGNSQVAARLEVEAGRDINVTSNATLTLTGDGSASLDIYTGGATRGNIDFQGHATVTAHAASFHSAHTSYGAGSARQVDTSYGSIGSAYASLRADGNVTLGAGASITINAEGNARATLVAGDSFGSGDVNLDGDLSVTATAGSFNSLSQTYQVSNTVVASDHFYSAVGQADALIRANAYGGGPLGNVAIGNSASINLTGAGEASLDATAHHNMTVDGPVTITANRGFQTNYSQNGHVSYGTDGTSLGFVLDNSSRNYESYGHAFLNLHADSGALTINAPISVTAAGEIQASLGAYNPNSSAAVVVNAPVTLTGTGGSGSYGSFYRTHSSFSSSSYLDRTRNYFTHISSGGRATLRVDAGGAYGDIVVTSYGGLDVSAVGDATLNIYAARDTILDGAVAVTAHAGAMSYASDSHTTRTFSNGDTGSSVQHSTSTQQVARAGLHLQNSARDLLINAPVTITGSGGASFTSYPQQRNILVNAPITVTDHGSAFASHYTSSSNRYSAGGSQLKHYDYFSDSRGVFGSMAHSGNAYVYLSLNGDFTVTSDGAITVQGVERAGLTVQNYGNSSTGGGAIHIDGPIVVAATPGDYRYASSSHSTDFANYSNSHYHFTSSSAFGSAYGNFNAARELSIGSGGGITMSGYGRVDLSLRSGANQDVTVNGPIQLTDAGGFYHSDSSYQFGSNAGGYNSNSDYSYNSDGGDINFTIDASRNIVIAAPVSVTANGSMDVTLNAGQYSYGDINITAPITLTATGAYHSSSAYNYHSDSTTAGGSHYQYTSASGSSFRGARANLTLNTNANGSYGGHILIGGAVNLSGIGDAHLNAHGANGIDVTAPIHVTATAGRSSSYYTSSYDSLNAAGTSGYHSNSASGYQASYGSASVLLDARRGPILVDGSITVSGVGDADVTLQNNYSGGQASYGITVNAPITATATRGHYAQSYAGGSSYFTVDSHGVHTVTSSDFRSSSSGSNSGSASVSVYNALGGITLGSEASITATAAGYARVNLDAHGDIVVGAPISVTATRGSWHQASASHSHYASGSFAGQQSFGSSSRSSVGGAKAYLQSRAGSVILNGALTVSGAGSAYGSLRANNYNSGSGSVQVNAPITVSNTGGTFFNSSHGQRLSTQTGSSSVTTLQDSDYAFSESGAVGYAGITLFAWGNVTQQATLADMSVSGPGKASFGATAYRGNVTLAGGVTVTATAGAHHFFSNGVNLSSSYGSLSNGAYGSASAQIDAYRQGSSGSLGNIQLNTLAVHGAGQAQASIETHSGGAVTVDGPITITSGRGTFQKSSHYHYDPAGNYLNAYSSSAYGGLGYGSLYIRGNSGITVHGAINVSGQGGASASLYADSGGVTVDGNITITSTKGSLDRHYYNQYHSSGAYNYLNSSTRSGSFGEASLNVYAYNGGNVDLANVTVSGYGDDSYGGAQAYIYSQTGSVTMGNLSVTAQSALRDTSYHNLYNPNPSYLSSGHGTSHNTFGSASAQVQGYAGVSMGNLTVTGVGSAYGSVSANQGTVTITGPVSITSAKGVSTGSYFNHYTNNVNYSYSNFSRHDDSAGTAGVWIHGQQGVDLSAATGLTVSAPGSAWAYIQANSGSVTVAGPISISAARGKYSGSNSNHYHSGSYYQFSHGTHDDSAGSASLYVTARSDVTLHAVTVTGAGSASASLDAGSGTMTISGPVTVTATRGKYVNSNSNSYSYSNGQTQTNYSHNSNSFGSASLDVEGGNGITVTGAVNVTGAGYANADFSTSYGGADITLGAVNVTATAADIDETYGGHFDNRGGYVSQYSGHHAGAYGSAYLDIEANRDITAGAITVSGVGYASASISASSHVTLTGPVSVTTTAGVYDFGYNSHTTSGGVVHDQGSDRDSTAGSASLYVYARGGVSMAGATVTGAGSAYLEIGASSGPINVTGPISVTSTPGHYTHDYHNDYDYSANSFSHYTQHTTYDGGTASLYIYNETGGISLQGITVTAPGSAYAYIDGSSGAVTINGAVTVTAARGHATSHNSSNAQSSSSGSVFPSIRSHDADSSYGSAYLGVYGYTGVTVNGNISVTGAGSAEASLYAYNGAVVDHGTLSVIATRGAYTSQNTSSSAVTSSNDSSTGAGSLNVYGYHGVTLDQGADVTGAGYAYLGLTAYDNVGISGPVNVTANKGDYGVGSSHGNASLYMYEGASYGSLTATDINVTGNGHASVYIYSPNADIANITVHANSGTYGSSSSVGIAGDGFTPKVSSFGTAGEAQVYVSGDYGSSAYGGVFGAHVGHLVADGLSVQIGGEASYDLFEATAVDNITAGYGGYTNIFADAAGFTAGSSIDLTGSRLGLGTGTAPFGTDNIVQFLLNVQVPGLLGDVTPNGGFSAPDVTFGDLNLTGTAIFIQSNDVSYNGSIIINSSVTLPPAGFAIRYDTFTPNATVHVVSTLPGSPVPGDVYYDSSDFAYPGTTYLIGGAFSFSPIIVGDSSTGAPGGGSGGDDNFIFLTNDDVAFDFTIPTSGQVLVIHPLASSGGLDIIPTSADWGGDQGGGGAEGDTKKESLEHEQQPQTSGGGEGEEGQIDNESGANLECH